MLVRYLLSFCLFVVSLEVYSQMRKDVFPLSREYKKGGFYVSPQATISFGNKETGTLNIVDTSYQYEVTGRGKWGYGVELGWFHTFKDLVVIDFVEGSVAYRVFQGAAEHKGELFVNDVMTNSITSDNTFKTQNLVGSVRAVEVKQLGKTSFLTMALGANFNYILSSQYKRGESYPNSYETFLNKTSAQAHVQVGLGFKASKKLLVIPILETPIVTLYPSESLNPAFPFFKANYHPLIIGLKFMFLREDPVNCNAPQLMGVPSQ